MSVLYVLLPLAIALAIAFVAAYAWSARTGQFDDLTTPAIRMLHDDVARPSVRPLEESRGSPPEAAPSDAPRRKPSDRGGRTEG